MKHYDDKAGFYFVYLDEVKDREDFEVFLFGSTVPEPKNGRKRAYYHDYLQFK